MHFALSQFSLCQVLAQGNQNNNNRINRRATVGDRFSKCITTYTGKFGNGYLGLQHFCSMAFYVTSIPRQRYNRARKSSTLQPAKNVPIPRHRSRIAAHKKSLTKNVRALSTHNNICLSICRFEFIETISYGSSLYVMTLTIAIAHFIIVANVHNIRWSWRLWACWCYMKWKKNSEIYKWLCCWTSHQFFLVVATIPTQFFCVFLFWKGSKNSTQTTSIFHSKWRRFDFAFLFFMVIINYKSNIFSNEDYRTR